MSVGTQPLNGLGEEIGGALVQLARALHLKNADLQLTLDAIITHAVQTIEPADHAGLILLLAHQLQPQATIGAPPPVLDSLQQETGSGPCIDAAREQSVILIEDTRSETRWPLFAEKALELGVSSMLCVPLWVDDLRLGTLSLYADRASAFAPHHLPITDLYAAHAAVALADAQRTAQLHDALTSRDVIGQAKGILVERSRITPDEAFSRLSLASQRANQKLVVVAEHLVQTGELL